MSSTIVKTSFKELLPEATLQLKRDELNNQRMTHILRSDLKDFENTGELKLKILKGISRCLMVACMIILLASTLINYTWTSWAACGIGLFLMVIKEIGIEPKIRSLEKTSLLSKLYLEMIPTKGGSALHPIGEADLPRNDPLLRSDKVTDKNLKQKNNVDFLRLDGAQRDEKNVSRPVLHLEASLPLKAAASKRYARVESNEWPDVARRVKSCDKKILATQKKYERSYENYEKSRDKLINDFEMKAKEPSQGDIRADFANIEKCYVEIESLSYEGFYLKKKINSIKKLVPKLHQPLDPDDETLSALKKELQDLLSKCEQLKQQYDKLKQQRDKLKQQGDKLITDFAKYSQHGAKLIKYLNDFFKARIEFTSKFAINFQERSMKRDQLSSSQLFDTNYPLQKAELKLKEKIEEVIEAYNKVHAENKIISTSHSLKDLLEIFNNKLLPEMNNQADELKESLETLQKDIAEFDRYKSDSIRSLTSRSKVLTPIFHSEENALSNEEKIHVLATFVSRFRALEREFADLVQIENERKKLFETTSFLRWSKFNEERFQEIEKGLQKNKDFVTVAEDIVSQYRKEGTFSEKLDENATEAFLKAHNADIYIIQTRRMADRIKKSISDHPKTVLDQVQKQLEEAQTLYDQRKKKLDGIEQELEKQNGQEETESTKAKDSKRTEELTKLRESEKKGLEKAEKDLKEIKETFTTLKERYRKILDVRQSTTMIALDESNLSHEERQKESTKIIKELNKLNQKKLAPLLKNLKRAFNTHMTRFINKMLDKQEAKVSILKAEHGESKSLNKENAPLEDRKQSSESSSLQSQISKKNINILNSQLLETDQKYILMTRFSRVVSIVIVTALLILGVLFNSPWVNLGICAGFFVSMSIRQGAAYYLNRINIQKTREKMQRLLINSPIIPEIPGHRPELHHLKEVSEQFGLDGTSLTAGAMVIDGYSAPKPEILTKKIKDKSESQWIKSAAEGSRMISRKWVKGLSKEAEEGITTFNKKVKKYSDPKVIEKLEKDVEKKKSGAQARLAIGRRYADPALQARMNQPLSSHWDQLPKSIIEVTESIPSRDLKKEVEELVSLEKKRLQKIKGSQEYQETYTKLIELRKKYSELLDKPKSQTMEKDMLNSSQIHEDEGTLNLLSLEIAENERKLREILVSLGINSTEDAREFLVRDPSLNLWNDEKNPWYSETAPEIYKGPKRDVKCDLEHLKALKENKDFNEAKDNYTKAKKAYEAILEEPKSADKMDRLKAAKEKLQNLFEIYQKISKQLKDQHYKA